MRAAARTHTRRGPSRLTHQRNNMPFPITPLATIEREAKAAAEKGQTPNDACRYPFDDPAGEAFVRIYNEHCAALQGATARLASEVPQ